MQRTFTQSPSAYYLLVSMEIFLRIKVCSRHGRDCSARSGFQPPNMCSGAISIHTMVLSQISRRLSNESSFLD
eukprot:753747-Hanusia_phi.AAC.2